MSQLNPGLSNAMLGIMKQCQIGKFPDNLGAARVRRATFVQRQALGAATLNRYTFGQVGQSTGVSNFPNQGNLPNDSFLLIQSVACWIDVGYVAAQTSDAEGVTSAIGTTTPIAALTEWYRTIHNVGALTLRIGDFNVIDYVPGLWHFPKCGGLSGSSSGWGTTTTQQQTIVLADNGGPAAMPYRIVPAYPWQAGIPLVAYVDFIGALNAPTSVDAILNFQIDGIYGTPR